MNEKDRVKRLIFGSLRAPMSTPGFPNPPYSSLTRAPPDQQKWRFCPATQQKQKPRFGPSRRGRSTFPHSVFVGCQLENAFLDYKTRQKHPPIERGKTRKSFSRVRKFIYLFFAISKFVFIYFNMESYFSSLRLSNISCRFS